MVNHARDFWLNGDDEYQTLAEAFERGIEITSPNGASCWCGDYCPWRATEITYYEYDGPQIV